MNKKSWVGSFGIAKAKGESEKEMESACESAEPCLEVDSHGIIIGHGEWARPLGSFGSLLCLVPEGKRELVSSLLDNALWKPRDLSIERNRMNDDVLFFTLRYPVPVFAVAGIERFKEAYDRRSANVAFHIDQPLFDRIEMEGFSLFPTECED